MHPKVTVLILERSTEERGNSSRADERKFIGTP